MLPRKLNSLTLAQLQEIDHPSQTRECVDPLLASSWYVQCYIEIFLHKHSLLQDDGLNDLARKYNITLESIALQTRHIIDELNGNGHSITSIYMSGGQAKNRELMQLFANVCQMPVVLPAEDGTAVVLGAAMLGRLAAEADAKGSKVKEMTGEQQAQLLWKIMVCCSVFRLVSRVG